MKQSFAAVVKPTSKPSMFAFIDESAKAVATEMIDYLLGALIFSASMFSAYDKVELQKSGLQRIPIRYF